MFTLKLDIFTPLLEALRGLAEPADPRPPRELRRMLDELQVTREKEKARALLHRLHGG